MASTQTIEKEWSATSSNTTIMDVHYSNWKQSVVITSSDTSQQLYTMKADDHRNHTITNAGNQTIGSTCIHQWRARIDVRTLSSNGAEHTFEITNDKIFELGSPRYTSLAFDGQKMEWNNKARSKNIIYTLIDGQGLALARFESNPKTKIGRLEIIDAITEEAQTNEIVVTLLTLLVRKLTTIEVGTIVAVT